MTKMYDEYKVYGPYTRKDGRQIVVLKTPGVENRKTVSYPKFLVELKIGRYLNEYETVDHIDGDFTNNNFDNLRVVPRKNHCRSHTSCKVEQVRTCPICGSQFITEEYWRKTCGSKRCVGKSAHLLGYNKGNDLHGVEKIVKSCRNEIDKFNLE